MIEQIKIFETNTIAVEFDESITDTDVKLWQKFFEQKLDEGFHTVNVLLKIKDMSILTHTSLKALADEVIWGFRYVSKFGRVAVVAESETLKKVASLKVDILHLANKNIEEKNFKPEELDEAFYWVNGDSSQ
ncbi:STAS/SEC14 domain-containing protein [Fluviicola sp.]|jgi:hypothetical protein|uniref:STAS/SEC14 domain-containing protein n=1 Tax=Fluviicola sp. TaxID=1917219 RepID=UPI0028368AFF|nr:STAS/SEC14 domain-containing protein [Fluviicola sp.]MDR0801908.1 STAS/SEC14 domain-containing protein [Fluviicola sp.]